MEIKKYRIDRQIYSGLKSVVYKGESLENGRPVVIKRLKSEFPSQKSVDKFRNQYDIVKELDINGIVKPLELVSFENSLVLVMEDIGGEDLKKALKGKKTSLLSFLNLAVKLADALSGIHDHNIIHKDIKPGNIIVTSGFEQVKISDFSIATRLSREKQNVFNENMLEGTLTYISPEQTGRMNRSLDYRTDLYSLGITFYELITGSVPFKAEDALGMVHLHIAGRPPAPGEVDRTIPRQISHIIMRLIAKNPEERYKSARGLKQDLLKCREELLKTGRLKEFSLGSDDYSDKFRISDRLYGREQEIKVLLHGFDECARGGRRMMLVAGKSGIGKSALIHELYKPIIKHRGFFISGKYSRLGKNIPYSALIEAFSGLIRRLLTGSEEKLLLWKEKILEALGDNTGVIINVIPALEYITGKQPEIQVMDPVKNQNRFTLCFQRFTALFSGKDHPLTMFLDDLQWADQASMQLIMNIITDRDITGFFLIGAYRDNEVSETHPLMESLEEIRRENVRPETVVLQPLNLPAVSSLIADSFESSEISSRELASVVIKKTVGNPFFIGEFLKNLYENKLLRCAGAAGWSWDIKKIGRLKVSDNVVELVADKIKKLPPETRDILTYASCIGSRFSIKRLAMVSRKPPGELRGLLLSCLEEGFIYAGENEFFFSHDKVQEAVYSLIPEQLKVGTHYTIGRQVLENANEKELDTNLFYITDQLNSGVQLIQERAEKVRLVSLNLKSGVKAIKSTAYEQAMDYLRSGMNLTDESWWESEYDLMSPLFAEAAEAAYLNTDFSYMEQLIQTALEHVKELPHKVRLYGIIIKAHASRSNHLPAIQAARTILRELGVHIPSKAGKTDAMMALIKTRMQLKGKSVKELLNYKKMTDPKMMAAIRIILSMATSAYFSSRSLSAVITCKMIYLSIKFGVSPISAVSFTAYGMILCGMLGQIEKGYEIGNMAQLLLEKFGAKELQTRTGILYNGMIRHWKKHTKEAIGSLKKGYVMGLEVGDLEFAFLNIQMYIAVLSISDTNRNTLYSEAEKYLAVARKFKHEKSTAALKRNIQYAANLMGRGQNRERLKGEFYDEDRGGENISTVDRGVIYFYDLLLAYLFGNYPEVVRICLEKTQLFNTMVGMSQVPVKEFIFCLALLAVYPGETKKTQKTYMKLVNKTLKKIKKWAGHAPMNHQHRYYLVEAEKARVLNQPWKAAGFYNKALKAAHDNEYSHEQAIAYECGAGFYMEQGNREVAGVYLKKSRYLFERWGAAEKVKQLEEKYPAFFILEPDEQQSDSFSSEESSLTAPVLLDLHSMLKASRTISVEIELEKLLPKMMEIVVENIGAQKGVLILESGRGYTIEAEVILEEKAVTVLRSIPLEEYGKLPMPVIHYALRTGEVFVTPDALNDKRLEDCTYCIPNNIKSLLCFPIEFHKQFSALLYFENNSGVNVFTPNRLEILKTLSGQIAISLENARLYENLKEQERLKQEMAIAERIQTAILPEPPDHGELEITALMKPADQVGGDYYDILFDRQDNLWLAIGDVSGHGVTPGLIMMMAQTSLVSILNEHTELNPAQALISVNKVLYDNVNMRIKDEHFMSVSYLKYLGEGRFLQTGAHLDIIIYRKSSRTCTTIPTGGTFLGFIPDIEEVTRDMELGLDRGDIMLLYTDGIIESRHRDTGELFEMARLKKIVETMGENSLEEIKAEILEKTLLWCGHKQSDDISMILVRRK